MFQDFEPQSEKFAEMRAQNYLPLLERLEISLALFHAESLPPQYASTSKDHSSKRQQEKKKPRADKLTEDTDRHLAKFRKDYNEKLKVIVKRPSPRAVVEEMKRNKLTPWTAPLHGGAHTLYSLMTLAGYVPLTTVHFGMGNKVPLTRYIVRMATARLLHNRFAADLPRLPWKCNDPSCSALTRAKCHTAHENRVINSIVDADPMTFVLFAAFDEYERLPSKSLQELIDTAKRSYDSADLLLVLQGGYEPLAVYGLRELLYLRSMILLTLVLENYENSKDMKYLQQYVFFLLFICKLHNAKEAQDLVDCVRLWNNLEEKMPSEYSPLLTRHTLKSGIYEDEKWSLRIKNGHFNATNILTNPGVCMKLLDEINNNNNKNARNGKVFRRSASSNEPVPISDLFGKFMTIDHELFCFEPSCTNTTNCFERTRYLRYLAQMLDLFVLRIDDELFYEDEDVDLESFGIFEADVSDDELKSRMREAKDKQFETSFISKKSSPRKKRVNRKELTTTKKRKELRDTDTSPSSKENSRGEYATNEVPQGRPKCSKQLMASNGERLKNEPKQTKLRNGEEKSLQVPNHELKCPDECPAYTRYPEFDPTLPGPSNCQFLDKTERKKVRREKKETNSGINPNQIFVGEKKGKFYYK